MTAGRRTSLASLAGQKVDAVPGMSDPLLLTLPLDKLVPTRFNPRRNFGSEDDLREFGLRLKKRQLQPAVIVSRTGYLKLWPEEADSVGSALYVIANGERRFRGSLAAGLATLNVVHNEDVAKSRADFLDAVLAENNDREDLDPIERAIGIETMVEQLGGAERVAEHYGKTKGWVSQQRKLLKLTPALQALVSQGEMPVRVARDIAGLPDAEQAEAWEVEVQRRADAERSPRAPRARKTDAASVAEPSSLTSPEASRFTAVNQGPSLPSPDSRFTAVNQSAPPVTPPDPARAPAAAGPSLFTAVNQAVSTDGAIPAPEVRPPAAPQAVGVPQDLPDVPDPRSEIPAAPPPPKPAIKMPWADGVASMDIIFAKLDETERRRAIARYVELLGTAEAFVADLSSATDPAFRAQVAELLLREM